MSFKGFSPNDFGRRVSGRWQASLGKELEEALSQELMAPFKYNRAGRFNLIYLRHDWYIPFQHTAFQVSPERELFAGLKIERGYQFNEKPEFVYHKGWDFWRFEQGLFNNNLQLNRAINYALERGLSLSICDEGDNERLKINMIEEISQASKVIMDWNVQSWCNVYVGKTLLAKEALKLGGQVTNFCMDSILAASKLYWFCVGR